MMLQVSFHDNNLFYFRFTVALGGGGSDACFYGALSTPPRPMLYRLAAY